MNKKQINKTIRQVSNTSSLPLLIFLIISFSVSFLLDFLVNNADYDSPLRNSWVYILIFYLVVYPITMPIIYLVFNKTRGKNTGITIKSSFGKKQRSAGWCFKWMIISIGISSLLGNIADTIFENLLGLAGFHPKQNFQVMYGDWIGLIVFLIAAIIFAPFFEELLFRGLIFRNNRQLGTLFAIIISGLAFGLWHNNYSQLVPASIFGMFFCFVYLKTKSIAVTMIFHFVNNLLCSMRDYSMNFLNQTLKSKDIEFVIHSMFNKHLIPTIIFIITIISGLLIIVSGVILFIIELIRKRKSLHFDKGSLNVNTFKKTAIYLTTPITLVTLIGSVAVLIYNMHIF